MTTARTEEDLIREAREFVLEHRADCLWFIREDLVLSERMQIVRLLREIEEHSDRTTFVEARRLRKCLSRNTSGGSAGS